MTSADRDDQSVSFREALDGIPPYRAGRPPAAVPGVTPHKMSSNENPYPPLPSVLEVARDVLGGMNRYPDAGMQGLRERIAEHVGVSADEIVTGAGSSGVLGQIITAAVGDGDEVVYAWRSFELYPILVGLAGARSVQVPLTSDGRHDLERMAHAVNRCTALVIVCSPNNPTGPAVSAEEFERFMSEVPKNCLVVLDEAYLEFDVDDASVDGLAAYRRHPNLVLLRTFSKAYGLAGLRVGYAVARPEIAAQLRKTGAPFAVTDVAQRAAVASLDARAELDVRVKDLVGERERLLAGLREQGWEVPDTQANFVWLPLGEATADFAEAAGRAGLSVRPFAGEGVRCSVDVEEANSRLLDVAREFRASL